MLRNMQSIRDTEKKSVERLLHNKFPSRKITKAKSGFYTFMNEEEINWQSFLLHPSTFFSWQCVSILHAKGITIDLVIRDRIQLMALLRVLEIHVNGSDPKNEKVLSKYIKLRFNNIVAFEAW